jgi:hypothetical protein
LSFVDLAGESNFPHTVIGIGFKTSISENVIREFKDKIKYWKEESYWINPPESGWKGLIKLLTPPILLYIYRKIR